MIYAYRGHYMFIDGAYLDNLVDEYSDKYFGSNTLHLDYNAIKKNHEKGFYYDCPIKQKEGEEETEFKRAEQVQIEKFKRIQFTPGMHIFKGEIRGEGSKKRQKGIDVKIAVDMFTHAVRRNMSHTTLLTGDRDFLPIVEALVGEGVFITLMCERKSASEDLIHAVDAREFIDPWLVSEWVRISLNDPSLQLPDRDTISGWPTYPENRTGISKKDYTVRLYQNEDETKVLGQRLPDEGIRVRRHSDLGTAIRLFEFEHGTVDWKKNY